MKVIYTVYILFLLSVPNAFAGNEHIMAIGPFGGIITSVVEDNHGNIFIGTEGGGVYKSIDNGNTWLSTSSGLVNPFVSISPHDGSIFAGTKAGVFRSVNNGKNWVKESGPSAGMLIPFIIINRDGVTYASIWGSGVCEKNGRDWELLNQELQNTFVNGIAFKKNGDVIAATEGGLYKIERGGQRWRFVGLIEYLLPTIVIDKNDHIYASAWGSGILRSIDGGKEWEHLSKGGVNSYTRHLTTSPDKNVIYAATEDGVFEFISETKEWKQRGLTGVILKNVTVTRDKRLWAGSYGKGLFFSRDNGITWQKKNIGITNTQIKSIFIDDKNTILSGTSWGLFIKNINEFEWKEIDIFSGKSVNAVVKDSNGNTYAGTTSGVFKYDVTTKKWDRVQGAAAFLNITTISIDDADTLYAGTDSDGLFVSKDRGESWKELDNGITNKRITAVKFDSKGILYVGTYDGVFKGFKDIKNSQWVFENITSNIKNTIILSITIDNDNIYIGTDGSGVYVKKDSSKSWVDVSKGLLNKRILSLHEDVNGNIYAGTYDGLFFLKQGSFEWKDVSEGMVNRIIQTISTDRDGNLLVGTWGGGILKAE
ncbi:MAG: hypothetical protein HZC45_03510 [Deltaproteobacteria bacterium]|nr:hypothetical protein [Deltaproteobacteria bacterium]